MYDSKIANLMTLNMCNNLWKLCSSSLPVLQFILWTTWVILLTQLLTLH